jgi:glycopeptide antibiotics resistance protein
MLHFFPIPAIIGLILLGLILILPRHRLGKRLWAAAIFGVYLLLLVDAVIFPLFPGDWTRPILTRQNIANTLAHANLHLGYFGIHITRRYIFEQIIYNILMTVPFGVGLAFFTRPRGWKIIAQALLVGLGTELSQLLVSILVVGGPYRGVDINDALLNTAGVGIGVVFFLLLQRLFPAARIFREN